ncbi:hypothetical protein KSU1_C0468 [Candidatus Jettenia caeni]|uniref:Uncharacterized protein n=1 Tax=Candidatus Jettenia caeni TaxID=247490 RepID=I3IK19_9BACT|nr:hypothetical protein [Candidatus Jettenia sp. AMX1]NUN22865.1 hypothetical protein [Candidatus Jettenia caeni]WKZ17327.1 MAG: hypothetical protein QY317_08415 [Candidatus Jettenia caeni]GAB62064.1 hypothetical protein KSU1_C0468 [Candidatus Jettenia caeni]
MFILSDGKIHRGKRLKQRGLGMHHDVYVFVRMCISKLMDDACDILRDIHKKHIRV